MATDPTTLSHEPLTLRSHLATAMFVMSLVFAGGTLVSWLLVRVGPEAMRNRPPGSAW